MLNPSEIVIDSVAVLIGDYSTIRKQAALLLLKHYLPHDFLKLLLDDPDLYPYDRDDPRVKAWRKEVLKKGRCELCGSMTNLEAHHKIKWADYPAGRIDPQNGQCLCHRCHTEEHRFDPSYSLMKAKL